MYRIIALLLISSAASGQIYQPYSQYGNEFHRTVSKTLIGIPRDTIAPILTWQTYPHIAFKGTQMYVWDTTLRKWSAYSSPSSGTSWLTTGNVAPGFLGSTDATPVRFRTNNILRLQIPATELQPALSTDSLLAKNSSGEIVTRAQSAIIGVTPGLQSVLTADPNLTGAHNVNGGGFSLALEEVLFSVSNLGPNRPITFSTGRFTGSLNPSNNLSITSDSTVFDQFCTGGSCAALNEGYYVFRNLAPFGDTTNYKPVSVDANGRIFRSTYWPGGSGATPTLQQLLTAGSTLTGANSISLGAFALTFQPTSAASGVIIGNSGQTNAQLSLRQSIGGFTASSYAMHSENIGTTITSGGAITSYGVFGKNENSRFSGANPLTNIGGHFEASGGQASFALELGVVGASSGNMRLNGSTSGTIGIQPAAAAGTYTLTLPTTDGAASEFLQTDGSGVLTWAAASGGGTPGGNTETIQLNRNGAFAGTDSLKYVPATGITFSYNGTLISSAGGLIITANGGTGIGTFMMGNGGLAVSAAGSSINVSGNPYLTVLTSGVYAGISGTPTSTLQSGGSFATGYVAKSANYTATINDYTIECTSGTFQVTLPTAVAITGRIYTVVNSGAGTITLGTTSSEVFVNVVATPTSISKATIGTLIVQSNGTGWMLISNL